MIDLFVGPVLLAAALVAPVSANFKQEVSDREAWAAFLEVKEDHYWKLGDASSRLADAQDSLRQQIERIERKEHLDIAALRTEQVLRIVIDLNKTLMELDKVYRTAPEPTGDHKRLHHERMAHERQELARLMDAKNGEIARTRRALAYLIVVLENEREPDVQVAHAAVSQLNQLADRAARFQSLIGPGIICYAPIEPLRAIEARQSDITARLRQLYLEEIGGRGK